MMILNYQIILVEWFGSHCFFTYSNYFLYIFDDFKLSQYFY